MIQELRIGNCVYDVHNRVANIVTIGNGTIRLSSKNYHYDSFNCSDIKPIPLTEDILLKCGFYECIGEDVNGYKKYINDDHLEFDVYLNNENHCCVHYLEVAFSNHPQSLHSLQNAIFALTGEELNVEL